jgi:hypothetical protein
MVPDERHVAVEDAARQIGVQPITLRRWLGIITMPRFEYEGTEYVLQEDVDAFNEACTCKNMRWTYEQLKAAKAGVA